VLTASVDMATMKSRVLPDPWRARFQEFALREEDFPSAR
jgi:hypothetical protein